LAFLFGFDFVAISPPIDQDIERSRYVNKCLCEILVNFTRGEYAFALLSTFRDVLAETDTESSGN